MAIPHGLFPGKQDVSENLPDHSCVAVPHGFFLENKRHEQKSSAYILKAQTPPNPSPTTLHAAIHPPTDPRSHSLPTGVSDELEAMSLGQCLGFVRTCFDEDSGGVGIVDRLEFFYIVF